MIFDSLYQFWENQHPMVRSNVRLGVGAFGLMLGLQAAVFVGLRAFNWRYLFTLSSAIQLLQTLLLLLFVLLAYNALKAILYYVRGEGVFTPLSVALTVLAVLLTALSMTQLPHVFTQAISYRAERPYEAVYEEFALYCQRWELEWAGVSNVTLDMASEEVGALRQQAEIFRLNSTIFFNFSPSDQPDLGLACALNQTTPPTYGRSNDYQIQPLAGAKYRFIEIPGRADR